MLSNCPLPHLAEPHALLPPNSRLTYFPEIIKDLLHAGTNPFSKPSCTNSRRKSTPSPHSFVNPESTGVFRLRDTHLKGQTLPSPCCHGFITLCGNLLVPDRVSVSVLLPQIFTPLRLGE
ncbi:hypothetical protein PIB30_102081 [Stylosanthes scabra]|uniref:Uncharacterized protein n=1 Tax=Stylosanthes scabra TaxID=79078 RepID=A0ABU6QXP1_9FABA|nr:hypothetical protein [Stylosanthes scabra]